jgi:hypothetical protein
MKEQTTPHANDAPNKYIIIQSKIYKRNISNAKLMNDYTPLVCLMSPSSNPPYPSGLLISSSSGSSAALPYAPWSKRLFVSEIFLCCTDLCLIVEGAQGNYKFVIIILGRGLNPFWFNPRFKVTSLSSFLT